MGKGKMPKMNNPASRLLKVVQDLKKEKPRERLDAAFANVLHAPNDYALLLRRVGYVLQLVEQTKVCIEAQDVEHGLYLEPVETIAKAFQGMHLGGPAQNLMQQLPDPAVVGLTFCAEHLSRHAAEGTLSAESGKGLLAEIDALLATVHEAAIPDEIKAVIIEKIEKLRQAIDEYDILGSAPIVLASDAILGATIRCGPLLEEHPDAKPIWKALWQVAVHSYVAIQVINNLAALPQSAMKMLGM